MQQRILFAAEKFEGTIRANPNLRRVDDMDLGYIATGVVFAFIGAIVMGVL